MNKKIKSAVISIAVIAVLLLAILIGVKNGTLDKLTKEMPTLATSQTETEKSAENESEKNESSSNSARVRNSRKRDIVNIGQEFELIDWDIRYGYDENNRDTYNVFNVTVKSVDISRECDFDIKRIDYGLTNKKDSMDDNNNFISDYYYVTVKLNVNKDINDHDVPPDGEISMFQTMWYIGKIDSNGTLQRISNSGAVGSDVPDKHGNVYFEKGETKTIILSISVSKASFDSYGQRKMVYFSISLKASHTTYAKINIKKIKEFKVTYNSISDPIYIDAITPTRVLNCLLKSINGGKEGITGKIASNYDSRLDNCVIVAAESIRGIPDAKLYTSYTKFVDWMESVFGFVPVIDGNIVQFVHRDTLFSTSIIKEFEVDHTEFTYSVDEKLIYSSVRVGYDKQDYDSINGRDEFRFTTEYMTGVDITDNKLELISPYRADAYGIEFLAQKRGKNTTDNESDNDVFFVGAADSILTSGVMCYKLIRTGWNISGVLNPDKMFNVMYNQRAMLLANSKYIGISADKLEFTSSDGNSDVVINNIALKDNFVISEKLATCGKVGFNTYDEVIPSPVDGIITLVKDEYLYKGFLSEVDGQIERFDGLKYELIVKSISKA